MMVNRTRTGRTRAGRVTPPSPLFRRVGYGTEVMGMALYNGKVYAGQLPMDAVYRLDGRSFIFMPQLDDSNVGLRRVWGMAVYDGKLFAGRCRPGM